MGKIIAIVGMPGAGKSTAAEVFISKGWKKIRFGDVTMEEIKRQGLQINEENESVIRETLRLNYGMDAYAKLNEPKIKELSQKSNVVIDGLYSWDEYLYLKPRFSNLFMLAIYSSPKTRHKRLSARKIRPLTEEEAIARDYSELQNLRKSEPITMADNTIINEGTLEEFKKQIEQFIKR